MRALRLLAIPATLGLATSCVGGDPASTDECQVTMRWLQKDAYAEYAGRTSAAWPPHTTMEMVVDCGGSTDDAGQENHGTAVDAKLSDGTLILEEVRRETAGATEVEATALLSAFESCHCDGTTFLSLDSVQDSVVQEVIGSMLGYLNANMTCTSGVTPSQVVGLLQNNDPDGAIAALDNCTFNSGHSWETAFNEAVRQSQGSLSGYHVCNNDAMLQSELFEDFADGFGVGSCNGSSSVCQGPEFFYTP